MWLIQLPFPEYLLCVLGSILGTTGTQTKLLPSENSLAGRETNTFLSWVQCYKEVFMSSTQTAKKRK